VQIRKKICLAVVGAFIATMVLVGLITWRVAAASLMEGIEEQLLLIGRGYASELSNTIDERQRVVQDLARDVRLVPDATDAMRAKLQYYPGFEFFFLTDSDGNVTAQYPYDRVLGAFDYAHEVFWRELRRTEEPSMSELRRVYGYPSFTFSAVLSDTKISVAPKDRATENPHIGSRFVHGVVAFDTLFATLQDVIIRESGYAFVVDQNGRFLHHPDDSLQVLGRLSRLGKVSGGLEGLRRQMLDQQEGSGRYVGVDGKEYLLAFLPLDHHGWSLGVTVPVVEFSGRITRSAVWISVVMAAAAVLVSIVVFFVVGKISRPVGALVSAMQQVEQGDLTVRARVDSNDEVARMATAFNTMTGRLSRSFKTIHQYNQTLEKRVDERTEELRLANEELLRDRAEMERQLIMARRVQQNLLPGQDTFPQSGALRFGSAYASMEAVGGDFYDVFALDDERYGFLIADVSGHGMPASLITTMAKVSFHTHAVEGTTATDEVLAQVNAEMVEFIGDLEYFVSAFFAIYDARSGTLRYTNAGHHPALLTRESTSEIAPLDSKGIFIGCFPAPRYDQQAIQIESGDRLVLFTDGVIDARNPQREQFEYERFLTSIRTHRQAGAQDFVQGILEDVATFMDGADPEDDRAVLCVDFVEVPSKEATPLKEATKNQSRQRGISIR